MIKIGSKNQVISSISGLAKFNPVLKLLFNDDERPFLVYPNHFPFRRAFPCLDKVALRLFSTSFLSVFDIWENNASEKSLFFIERRHGVSQVQ